MLYILLGASRAKRTTVIPILRIRKKAVDSASICADLDGMEI